MKRFLSILLAILMLAVMLPVTAMAEGNPTCVDDVWQNVTPANVQDVLDGKYGPIDGTTIVLTDGNYGQLVLGRATKYEYSHTKYMVGGFDSSATGYQEFGTAEALKEYKNNTGWTPLPYYIRSMSNVTLKAAAGANVTVAGVYASSGHMYGSAIAPIHDYVRDINIYDTNNSYYLAHTVSNITFEGITFTAKSDICTSISETTISGITFRNCTFSIGDTAGTGNQALRYYNENNNGNLTGLTVENCKFKDCFQGVYTQNIKDVTVINSSFNTTGHNAIAVQSGSGPVNHNAVVITGNTFTNIGDRIIRFGDVGAGTAITISGNTSTNSGKEVDGKKEIIAAVALSESVSVTMAGNKWGENTKFGNGFENVVDEPIPEPSTPIIIYTPDSSPVFLSGANQTVAPGSAATFRIDKEFSELQSVAVDGVTLDKSNYKAWSGSTYVELTASYMKTLAVGTHTLSVYFTGDTATTTFTISKDATKNPTTGANDFVGIAAAAAVVALLGSAVILRKK